MRTTTLTVTLALTIAAAGSAAAFEATGDAAVDALMERLEAHSDATLTYDDVSSSGGATELSSVVIQFADDAPPMRIPTMEFVGGAAHSDGSISFDGLTLANATMEDDEGRLTLGSLAAEGLVFRAIPADIPDEKRFAFLAPLYTLFDLRNFSLNLKGDEPRSLSFDAITATAGDYVDDIPLSWTATMEGITVPVDSMHDDEAEKALAAMDLDAVVVDVDMSGEIRPDEEIIEFSDFFVTLENMGAIGLSVEVGGIGMDLVKEIQNAVSEDQIMAMGMRLLQGSLVSASIEIVDDSMTNKLLAYAAGQMGATPEALIAQAEFILPTMLSQLGDLELQSAVSQAVAAFLKDPENLYLGIEPEAPVPFGAIVAVTQNPSQLPQLVQMLDPEIVANEE